MNSTIYLRLLVAGITLSLMQGCNSGSKQIKPAIIPEVNVVKAGQGTVPVYAEYVGQTFGAADIKIFPRTEGLVTGVFFRDGQRVEKGALLYTIDDHTIRTQLNGYRANAASAATVMINKKADLDRVQPLAAISALSKHDLDAAVAAYESAKDQVAIAKAQLADVNIQLGYTRITAPISGLLGMTSVHLGDYVGGPSSGLLNTISATNNITVKFPVSEADYLRFIKRMNTDSAYNKKITTLPVKMILADGSIYNQPGKLVLADRQIDPATGSILVQAEFPNAQKIIRPGQYARIQFQSDELKNVVMVPQQAVNQLQDIYQVFIVNDSNKLVPTIVKPGARTGSNWIIEQGIKTGDRVAVIGNAFINPKLPVKPKGMVWDYSLQKAN